LSIRRISLFAAASLLISSLLSTAPALGSEAVTVDTFVRAETDMTLKRYVDQGGFGKFLHIRQPTPIDKQDVIRMNRDMLYSLGVFDLSTPVTIVKPDSGERFQSMLIINQDHSMLPVEHGPGEFTLTQDEIGTRYVIVIFRSFVDAGDEKDVAVANALQDKIVVKQEDAGSFEVPDWDEKSLGTLRDAINVLATTRTDTSPYFGDKSNLNPLYHLLGTAVGWGGNPPEAAMYVLDVPEQNDGSVPHSVTVKDVPVDGFWSITVYNAMGFMEENELGAYSFNNVTAAPNDDGSITINFGGCDDGRVNCLPISKGWNYAVRQYQPRQEIIDGSWTFPRPEPVN
jgi:hypothetical protein